MKCSPYFPQTSVTRRMRRACEIDPPEGIHMHLICRVDPNSPPPTIWQICLHPSGMTCAENELSEKVIDAVVHRPHSVKPARDFGIGEIH